MIIPYKNILVTGGVGSVGSAVVDRLIQQHPEVEIIRIFSRDEHKQIEMMQRLSAHSNRLEFLIGDMRDPQRVREAVKGIDAVIHAAAMRLVPMAELNPFEAVRTNVEGTRNLIEACEFSGAKKVLAISSDKAVCPTTAYGSTKFLMEKLLLRADVNGCARYSAVRYANILSSRSSVAPLFLQQRQHGYLTLTDPNMTRFSITMDQGIDLVLFGLVEGKGGDLICPISPSYKVADMAEAIGPGLEHRVIGARPGEKLHEAMFSSSEAPYVLKGRNHYVVLPPGGRVRPEEYSESGAFSLQCGTEEYESGKNPYFLSSFDLRNLIEKEMNVSIDGVFR